MTTREKLERAFDLRGMPLSTRKVYAGCIDKFEQFFGRSADELNREEPSRRHRLGTWAPVIPDSGTLPHRR
jgi:hypothetical protein